MLLTACSSKVTLGGGCEGTSHRAGGGRSRGEYEEEEEEEEDDDNDEERAKQKSIHEVLRTI